MNENILNYPLNVKEILKSKLALKRHLLSKHPVLKKNIAILGGSTTAEIKNILELFLLKEGIAAKFYESDYNKYFEDVIFENPRLKEFQPDLIWIHTTVKNISSWPHVKGSSQDAEMCLEAEIGKYRQIWAKAKSAFNCPIIQNNFDYLPIRPMGNLDAYHYSGKARFVNELNRAITGYAQDNKNVFINDIHYLSSSMGLKRWFDPVLWYSYKYAVSYEAIPILAHNLSRIICGIFGKSNKCLILDLDNTLWGGVVGDDGVQNLKIGKETAVAEAYTGFQEYVKDLRDRGVVVAVCSKNDEANAKEAFTHPDMILKLEDISSFKANWDMKSLNIKKIAEELALGLDSFVFVDDNPVEREIVREHLPAVKVPEVGSDIAQFIDILDSGQFFEPVTLSDEDLDRTELYRQNQIRSDLEAQIGNYNDFLRSLDMYAEILPFSDIYMDRIAQLINKTNQFNLTTLRLTQTEVHTMAGQKDRFITLYGRLKDKFGDNGLVSIMIGEIKDKTLDVILWLMSCRVLRRGMEQAMFDELVRRAQASNIHKFRASYLKTNKNSMVAELLPTFGFDLVNKNENGDSSWQLEIKQAHVQTNQFIKVNEENSKHGHDPDLVTSPGHI